MIKDFLKLAAFPMPFLLALYNSNSDLAVPFSLIRPSIIMLLLTGSITLLGNIILSKKDIRDVFMRLFLVFIFFYGHFQQLINPIQRYPLLYRSSTMTFISYIGIFLIVAVILSASKQKWKIITITDHATMLLLVFHMYVFGTTIMNADKQDRIYTSTTVNVSKTNINHALIKPDIYLLLMDGYARADILKSLYDYDNTEFTDSLADMGFYVASSSASNYVQTYLTVSSMLNLDYLDLKKLHIDPLREDREPLKDLIRHNIVTNILNEAGYALVIYGSGWLGSDILKSIPTAKLYTNEINEFELAFLNTTIVLSLTGSNTPYAIHRTRIKRIFEEIPLVAEDTRSTFLYAHIGSPHPPFVFTQNGSLVKQDRKFSYDDPGLIHQAGFSKEKYRVLYKNQLIYINSLVKHAVKEIISRSKEPPIIIIMSDHGPATEFSFGGSSDIGLKERFSILNAYYFPDQMYNDLKISISPVNTFRIIFSQYFGFPFDSIEDKFRYYSEWETPYRFEDVTKRYEQTNY